MNPLKLLLTSTVFLISGLIAKGAVKTSAATGSWNTPATWSPSGVPASTDEVIILSGHTITLNASPSIINITINSGGSLVGDGSSRTLNLGTALLAGDFVNDGILDGNLISIALNNSGTFSGTGTWTFSSVNLATTKTLTLGSGVTLNLKGAAPFTNPGTLAPGTNSTINLSGTVAQTLPAIIVNNLTTNNTSATGVSLTQNLTATNLTGNLTVASGTLTSAGFSITGTAGKTLTVSSGATLNLSGATTDFPSGFGTTTLDPASTVNYSSTSADQTVKAINYGNLTISGSLRTGDVILEPGTIGVAGTLTFSTSFLTGALTTTGNTVSFNGTGSQSVIAQVGGLVYNNLDINKSSGIATLGGNLNLTNLEGNLSITSGTFSSNGSTVTGGASQTLSIGAAGIVDLSGNTTAFPTGFGTVSINSSGTVIYSGAVSQSVSAQNYGNLTFTGSSARVLANTGTIGIAGTFTVGSNTITNTGSTIEFKGSGSQTIPAITYNNLISSSTGARILASSGTISIAGTFTPGSNAYTTTGSTVDFNSSSSQTIPALNYNNLTSSSTGPRTLPSSGTIGIAGHLNTATSNTFTTTGSTVTFNGSGGQALTGGLGSSASPFNNLIVNNSGTGSTDGVALEDAIHAISGTLTLTAGQLILNGSTLTINNGATSAITRTAGIIKSESTDNSSKVQWNIASTPGAHLIPFGKSINASDYIPFTIDRVSGNLGNVSVSTYPTAADNTPLPTGVTDVDRNGNDNSANVVDRFWQIDATGSITPNATLTFTCTSAEATGISTLRAQRWNTTEWATPLTGQSNPTSTSVTVPGVTAFSPWTLYGNNAPMPVQLLSFKAERRAKTVELTWSTASELNSERFEIERIAADGRSAQAIGNVSAAGNSQVIRSYSFMDENAPSAVTYYRLKQIDFDGKYTYSSIASVSGLIKGQLTLIPNPASSEMSMMIDAEEDQEAILQVTDITGKLVYESTRHLEKGQYTIPFDISDFDKGLYMIILHTNGRIFHERLIKQ